MKKNGFSTIIAVLIVGAVGLSVVLTLSMLAISSNRIMNSFYYSKRAEALAGACVMRGLLDTRNNTTFTGFQSAEINGEICSYSVSYFGASTRQVEAVATVKNTTKRIRAIYKIERTKLVLTSWEELSDF